MAASRVRRASDEAIRFGEGIRPYPLEWCSFTHTPSNPMALGIKYLRLDSPQEVAHRIHEAHTLAESSLRPVALLLTRDLMWDE